MSLAEDLREWLDQPVVLDTLEHTVFLGRLTEVTENGFWLADADVHDCRDGHAGKEAYVAEACAEGISINRPRVFVLRSAVCSVSRLDTPKPREEPPGGTELKGAPVPTPDPPRGRSARVAARSDEAPSRTPEV